MIKVIKVSTQEVSSGILASFAIVKTESHASIYRYTSMLTHSYCARIVTDGDIIIIMGAVYHG